MAEEAFPSERSQSPNPRAPKRKRNLPGTPDPEAEVIALSPRTLLATNRFLCEICGKGFQRDQNLQLHRRGHNLPWKLRQRTSKDPRKRVYVCPEKTCIHNNPLRALGDLTGIKKHFCRKHGEKKWKCDRCSKHYAVQSDWKAHSKTCGTREYRCDCGTLFSRRDSFITHRAFCDAFAEEAARVTITPNMDGSTSISNVNCTPLGGGLITSSSLMQQLSYMPEDFLCSYAQQFDYPLNYGELISSTMQEVDNPQPLLLTVPSMYSTEQSVEVGPTDMSATALLQRAAHMGVTSTSPVLGGLEMKADDAPIHVSRYSELFSSENQSNDLENPSNGFAVPDVPYDMTRDFLGVGAKRVRPSPVNEWIAQRSEAPVVRPKFSCLGEERL